MPLYVFQGPGLFGVMLAKRPESAAKAARTLYGTLRGPYQVRSATLTELRRCIETAAPMIETDGKPMDERAARQWARLPAIPARSR